MSEPATGEHAPLGFWIFVVLAGLYLAVRLVQGIVWLVDWLG